MKRAHIVTSFTDAGTGKSFTAGETIPIEAGAFANYEAGGLVRAPDPERAKRKPSRSTGAPRRTAASRAPASAPPTAAPASKDPAPSA